MNKFVIFAATAAATISTNAFAADTSVGDVTVLGNVAKLCVLGTPSRATIDLGQMAETSGTNVGKLRTLGNEAVTLPGSFCNFANSQVTVEATALVADNTTAAQTGFARTVNFKATASNWATTNAAATTAADRDGLTPTASGSGSVQPLPRLADITVTLSDYSVPGNLLMVSGGYTGAVIVTLAPGAAL